MTPVLLLIPSMPGCDGLGKLNRALEKGGYRNKHILEGLAYYTGTFLTEPWWDCQVTVMESVFKFLQALWALKQSKAEAKAEAFFSPAGVYWELFIQASTCLFDRQWDDIRFMPFWVLRASILKENLFFTNDHFYPPLTQLPSNPSHHLTVKQFFQGHNFHMVI